MMIIYCLTLILIRGGPAGPPTYFIRKLIYLCFPQHNLLLWLFSLIFTETNCLHHLKINMIIKGVEAIMIGLHYHTRYTFCSFLVKNRHFRCKTVRPVLHIIHFIHVSLFKFLKATLLFQNFISKYCRHLEIQFFFWYQGEH